MRAITPLVIRNLKRGRGQFAVTILLTIIAAVLLNAATILATHYYRSYDAKAEHLATPSAFYLLQNQGAATVLLDSLEADPRVSAAQSVQTLVGTPTLDYNGQEIAGIARFDEVGASNELNQVQVGESLDSNIENPIIAPLILKYGGYALGDPITFVLGSEEITFHIQGFLENPTGSSMTMGTIQFQVPQDGLDQLRPYLFDGWEVSALVSNPADALPVLNENARVLQDWASTNGVSPNPVIYQIDADLLKSGNTMTGFVFAMMITAAGLILTIVVIVVVAFMIREAVVRDMRAIGSLKALGFTSRGITLSIVGQYMVTTVLATILGIAITSLVMPSLATALEAQTGLRWEPGFDVVAALVTVAILVGTVVLAAVAASGRIRRTPPVQAMRGGVATHAFNTNPLPLATTRGPVDLLLGVKSIIRNKATSLVTVLLIAVASFSGAFAAAVHTNILADAEKFVANMWGITIDVGVDIAPGADPNAVLAEVRAISGVEGAVFFEDSTVTNGDQQIRVHLTEDFSQLRTAALYQGRAPQRSDEVALGANAADALGVGVGDTVSLDHGSTTANYLVTGLMQSAASMGYDASMTIDGYRQLDPHFVPSGIGIFAREGENLDSLVTAVREALGTQANSVVNSYGTMQSIFQVWLGLSGGLSIGILVLTAAVILLVLGLVVAARQTAQRREVGIMRAPGFSRRRISRQVTAAHLPVVATGAAVGLFTGWLWAAPLLAKSLSMIGLRNPASPADPVLLVAIGVAILAISAGLLAIMGRRVGTLTSRELLAE